MGLTFGLSGEEAKMILDQRINDRAKEMGHSELCPRCNTFGYGLYQTDYCARCAYTGPEIAKHQGE